jgi:hypothetical protein
LFGQKPSNEALPMPTPTGTEIVPKPEAIALAEYLLSLRADMPLFEVPPKIVPTNATPTEAVATNAPAAPATNSPK